MRVPDQEHIAGPTNRTLHVSQLVLHLSVVDILGRVSRGILKIEEWHQIKKSTSTNCSKQQVTNILELTI